jgi:hypothetical protein
MTCGSRRGPAAPRATACSRRRRTAVEPGRCRRSSTTRTPRTAGPGSARSSSTKDGSLLDVMAIVATDRTNPSAPNATQEIAIRSVNGGRTWSKKIPIGRSSGRGVKDPTTCRPPNNPSNCKLLNTFDTYPSQTVAPNGDVYVSWLQPGVTHRFSRIAVARSTDSGRHWRTRHIAVHGQAALPTIEVAGDGTVGVVYYRIAPKSTGGYWPARVAVATSTDHGHQWKPTTSPDRSTCSRPAARRAPAASSATSRAWTACLTAWPLRTRWGSRSRSTRSTSISAASPRRGGSKREKR